MVPPGVTRENGTVSFGMKRGLSGIGVLFAVLVGVFGFWFVAYPQNQQFIVGFGTLFGSLILVFITVYYTYATFALVAETRRDREIKWIEERLSKLYHPFLKLMLGRRSRYGRCMSLQSYIWGNLEDVIYLDDGSLTKKINRFLNAKSEAQQSRLQSNAIRYVRLKIDALTKRLHELHGS